MAAAGNAVLIFPQGRHVTAEQELSGDPLARFRPGVAYLAAALDAVVVPFGLAGTGQLLPGSEESLAGPKLGGIPLHIQRGPVAIAFGPPLSPEPAESPQHFTERLERECLALTRRAEAALANVDATAHRAA
jgi:1-acyl-sn-glycerol-3-phosphate acyltransferase